MKIMSLNVNKFCPVSILEGSKVHEIIDIIIKFCIRDKDNVVFLQEVPCGFVEDLRNVINRKLKDKDKEFRLEVRNPEIEQHNNERTYTIAIFRDDSKWEPIEEFKKEKRNIEKEKKVEEFNDRNKRNGQPYPWFYENKFIEIKNETLQLQLLGVHAPWQREKEPNSITIFFEALKQYAYEKQKVKFVIVGDLNADTVEGSTYCEEMNAIRDKCGYTLAVEALGKGTITYRSSEKNCGRIDHVMASPALTDRVTAQVIPWEVLELSDHAVIIIDVQI